MTPPATPGTPPLSPSDQIGPYISGMELVARFAAQRAAALTDYTIINALRGLSDQVLRAAEVDRRRLPHALEKYRLGNTLELHDIGARYGVTLHD